MPLSNTSNSKGSFTNGSMRITKESLFTVLNLQTLSTDGNMMNMFSQRGDADYVIEVVGRSLVCVTHDRSLDE